MTYTSRSPIAYTLLDTGFPVYKWDSLTNETEFYASAAWAIVADEADYLLGNALSNGGSNTKRCFLGSFYIPKEEAYTVYVLARKNSDCGILKINLDGVDLVTFDLYAAGATTNNFLSMSLGTLTVGQHSISLFCNSKNIASTNYIIILQSIMIKRSV